MSNTKKVDDFLDKLDHPLKEEMKAIRAIITANPKIEEDVKWGGPSFSYKEELATFSPRVKDAATLIFHQGALLKDDSGLLEPGPKGKAYAKLRNMGEIEAGREALERLVDEWIELMDRK
ncbi:uncharacterized protein YdeI (YjbR/CyaY-like superfamily) [Nonomuraea thailandensis]|uniref:Uncharacterized protein YdeI (YjbR/CyaY-like superfamily) n=1 Tax=Nonomuraea thailandensis TaxID=1188745 RepID=A0A9X2GFQ9_9ACTN|nr:DUF1801 domain-containing protein [Nonomuraea thailandensis]MCP2357015.1 uncharacterized protein YdeI (YjbR/CyaY-like superfamily) [Nonomuraea thailandensis]